MLIIYYSTLRNFIFDIDWNCLQNVTTLYFLYWYHIILLEGYSMAGQLYWIHEDPAMLQGTWRSQWGCSKVDTTWSVQAISRSTWWSIVQFRRRLSAWRVVWLWQTGRSYITCSLALPNRSATLRTELHKHVFLPFFKYICLQTSVLFSLQDRLRKLTN